MPISLTLNLEVSDEDIAVINHIVASDVDQQPGETPAEAWLRRVWRDLGIRAPQAVHDKVNKYRAQYLAAKAEQGDAYKDAAQRAANERALKGA